MKSKTVYQTNHLGLYVGPVEAEESPLEPGVYLMPAGSVETPPPIAPEFKIACWMGSEWRLLEYFGGLTVYNTETAEPMVIDGIGPIPNGYTLKKPGPNQVWKNGEWVDDINAVLQALFDKKLNEFADTTTAYIEGGFESTALGDKHQYDSKLDDQVNLIVLALADEETSYPCTDSNTVRIFRPHTVEQLREVGVSLGRFKRKALEHHEGLRLELVAALQEQDLERMRSLVWSAPL